MKFLEKFFKPKITFYSAIPALIDVCPPTDIKREFSEVMKKVKPITRKFGVNSFDIKHCPGIVEYAMSGYIIRAWQDIAITTENDGETYRWETPAHPSSFISKNYNDKYALDHEVIHFNKEFYYDYFPRTNTLKTVLNISTPWYVKLPKGYNLLYAPVWYDNEERFTTIPGLLDTNKNNKINVLLYWHRIGTTEIIKAGTPLAKLVPIKNEIWHTEVTEVTEKLIEDHNKISIITRNKF